MTANFGDIECECKTWARCGDDLRWPISNHHPNCPSYKLEEFAMIECCGSRVIDEPGNSSIWLSEAAENDDEIRISTVLLTRDQFENLKDFEGF